MRKMKESGIPWIGEIPCNWVIMPISSICTEVTTKNCDGKVKTALKFTYGDIIPKTNFDADAEEYVAKTIRTYTKVKPGNIVINGLNLNYDLISQRVGLVKNKGIITSAYLVINPIKANCESNYLHYLLKGLDGFHVFHHWGKGLRQTLNFSDFKRYKIAIPSLIEQKSIADYLDAKCADIDALQQDLQAEIETLQAYKKSLITRAVTQGLDPHVEMKDSGVEWIGEIPKTWKIYRIQDLYECKKGPFGSAITLNMFMEKGPNTYKIYEQKNAIYKDAHIGDYYISEGKYKTLSSFAVKPGDIIVSCAGTIGESYLLPENIEPGIINQALMRVRMIKKINARYGLLLLDLTFKYAGKATANGSAMKNIPPFAILKKLKVPYPSLKEQHIIIDYLDTKCTEIDSLIASKQKQSEILSDYKKSLIYEVVTGKKEVPVHE